MQRSFSFLPALWLFSNCARGHASFRIGNGGTRQNHAHVEADTLFLQLLWTSRIAEYKSIADFCSCNFYYVLSRQEINNHCVNCFFYQYYIEFSLQGMSESLNQGRIFRESSALPMSHHNLLKHLENRSKGNPLLTSKYNIQLMKAKIIIFYYVALNRTKKLWNKIRKLILYGPLTISVSTFASVLSRVNKFFPPIYKKYCTSHSR